MENTSAIILRIDPSGVMTFANKRALEFFGYTTEEMIGKHVVGTIVPPQETTGRDLAAMVDEIINNPAHFYSNANENICKDGRRVWIEWTNSGVYNNDGSLKEFLSVGIDATESKKAFQTQEYLRALMDHSPSLAFLKDEFGRYVYVNKSYIDQFNLPQDWIGKTDFDFWPKETAELFRKNDVDVLRSGQTQQFLEDSFDLNGNRHCWLCYKFMFTDSNGRPYVGGIGIDNVDRIRAEEALAKSEKKYRTLFEMIDEGFCVIEVLYDEADCSSDWRFLEVNPAFEIQTGINNAIGRRMREIAPDLEEHWFKIFGNVALSGQPIRCENPALAIGHYYEVYAFRVGKPEQRRVGILFNDIRKRKQAENEREDLIARLQMVNKELESFTYSVSHDLRAPLRAIDSLSRMLIMDLEEKRDTEAKRRLHFIRDNTIKMNSLIDNLLALSRITRTEMTCIKVDMKALAESAWKAALDANPETKASISIGDLPEAMGNQNLLFQVFTNLLSNAAKYTKKRRKALIEVGGEIKGQENVYYVKDNGAGFNMKYYDKLFGVFQRLHPESEYEGTGVGLAIVQRIIHRHGGRVWAKGKVGKGATFYFTLRNQA